jgi:hypothetical protein
LVAHLMADSAVTALIATRLYPMVIPQDQSLPAAAYQRISGPRDHTHDGRSDGRPRIQITLLGSTYAEAKSLATAVRASLDGRRRGLPGVRCNAVMMVDERDVWLPAFEKPGIQQDYIIYFET